ncbi:hypothetical protein Lal_00036360 [Lupinus albus]|nr:hypothetical protein Lal_00036360 [Lupinus albus]
MTHHSSWVMRPKLLNVWLSYDHVFKASFTSFFENFLGKLYQSCLLIKFAFTFRLRQLYEVQKASTHNIRFTSYTHIASECILVRFLFHLREKRVVSVSYAQN